MRRYTVTGECTPVTVSSLSEATDYVLGSAVPDITAFDGYPKVQQEIASEIAADIYDPQDPAKDISFALSRWMTAQAAYHSLTPLNPSEAIDQLPSLTQQG